MAITSAIERGNSVYVYDENGLQRAVISLWDNGKLQGYTATRISVRCGSMVYVYDETGLLVNNIPV